MVSPTMRLMPRLVRTVPNDEYKPWPLAPIEAAMILILLSIVFVVFLPVVLLVLLFDVLRWAVRKARGPSRGEYF